MTAAPVAAGARRVAARPRHAPPTRFVCALLACLSGALSGCTDKDIEKSLGDIVSRQVESAYRVERDPLVSDWVREKGTLVADQSRRAGKVPYDFKVINSHQVNAFAVPYGHVYLTTGLLETAESEDEVVAVLGHEWGHVARRHSLKAFKKQLIWGTLTGLALKDQERWLQSLGGIGLTMGFLKMSREDEREADDKGVELTYAAGYDPQGEIAFFEKLIAKRKGGRPSKFEVMFMTHPKLEQRVRRVGNREELSQDNAEALAAIGAGYVRRYRLAEGIERLERAVELDGELPAARRALGDAYLLRERRAAAAEQYRAALDLAPEDAELKAALVRCGEPAPETAVASLTPAARRTAEESLRVAASTVGTAAQTRQAVLDQTAENEKKLRGARKMAVTAVRAVDSMYGALGSVGQGKNKLTLAADAAVHGANEALYALETMGAQTADGVERVAAVAARARAALQQALDLGASQRQVEVLAEAVREARTALAEYKVAAQESDEAIPAIKQATNAATAGLRDVSAAVVRPMGMADAQMLHASLKKARESGAKARAAAQKAKRIADTARTRTLLAQIDVATALAPAERRPIYDGLVAGYLGGSPGQVASLRDRGYGYGDICLALAAAKSMAEDPEFIAEHGRGLAQSLVDYVNNTGEASLRNVNIFLKYIANAVEKEAESS